jgi:hypothetical protein
MKNISMALCLLSIGFCPGCCPDKETPGLPPVTSEGKNTFACKINGEVFVADGSGTDTPNRGIYGIIDANFDSVGNILPLDSSNLWVVASSGSQVVSLYLNPYLAIGKHLLVSNTYTYPIDNSPENYGYVLKDGKSYTTTTIDTGSVCLTRWDKKKFIISGTFQFKAKNLAKKSETIEVTEGRFDLDYSKTH